MNNLFVKLSSKFSLFYIHFLDCARVLLAKLDSIKGGYIKC